MYPKCLQEELSLQTVLYYIQYMTKLLSSRGPKFPEEKNAIEDDDRQRTNDRKSSLEPFTKKG